LAAQVIVEWLLSRPALAGAGSVSAPRPDLLQDDRAYYVVLLAAAVVAVVFAHNLARSRLGRAMVAARDREIAVAVIGIDVTRVKLVAFGLGALYAALPGPCWVTWRGA
jgi:branched-chain amino acid transport system permease protein